MFDKFELHHVFGQPIIDTQLLTFAHRQLLVAVCSMILVCEQDVIARHRVVRVSALHRICSRDVPLP